MTYWIIPRDLLTHVTPDSAMIPWPYIPCPRPHTTETTGSMMIVGGQEAETLTPLIAIVCTPGICITRGIVEGIGSILGEIGLHLDHLDPYTQQISGTHLDPHPVTVVMGVGLMTVEVVVSLTIPSEVIRWSVVGVALDRIGLMTVVTGHIGVMTGGEDQGTGTAGEGTIDLPGTTVHPGNPETGPEMDHGMARGMTDHGMGLVTDHVMVQWMAHHPEMVHQETEIAPETEKDHQGIKAPENVALVLVSLWRRRDKKTSKEPLYHHLRTTDHRPRRICIIHPRIPLLLPKTHGWKVPLGNARRRKRRKRRRNRTTHRKIPQTQTRKRVGIIVVF